MRTIRPLIAVAALVALAGCAVSPRPARTEVTPGETEIRSEREERRPSESTLRIRATVPPAPTPERDEAPIRIRLILPGTATPAQEDVEGGEG